MNGTRAGRWERGWHTELGGKEGTGHKLREMH